MDRWLAVVAMGMVGAGLALQPAINANLARSTGQLPAALISFLVGAGVILVVVAMAGELGGVRHVFDVPWVYLLGGVLGAIWIAVSLIIVKTLGAGGVVAATITGQLVGAVIADRFGVFGLDEVPFSAERVIGVALLIVGTYLVVR